MTSQPRDPRLNKVTVEQVKVEFDKGLSVNEIGSILGVSKNTISGIMFRNRDIFPKRTESTGRPRKPKIEKITPITTASSAYLKVKDLDTSKEDLDIFQHKTESAELRVRVFTNGTQVSGKTLMMLGDRDCKYVVDERSGAEALFCGMPMGSKYPYCDEHSKLMTYERPVSFKLRQRGR